MTHTAVVERVDAVGIAIENRSEVEFVEAAPAGNCSCAPCAACCCCCCEFDEIL